MIQRRMHQLNGPSYRATLGGRPEVPLPGVAGRVVAVTAHLPKPPFPTVLKMGVISGYLALPVPAVSHLAAD